MQAWCESSIVAQFLFLLSQDIVLKHSCFCFGGLSEATTKTWYFKRQTSALLLKVVVKPFFSSSSFFNSVIIALALFLLPAEDVEWILAASSEDHLDCAHDMYMRVLWTYHNQCSQWHCTSRRCFLHLMFLRYVAVALHHGWQVECAVTVESKEEISLRKEDM